MDSSDVWSLLHRVVEHRDPVLLYNGDEQKPECGNCIKHSVTCDFLGDPGTPKSAIGASGGDSLGLNLADLELLHNYTISTYSTLGVNTVMREFYRTTFVQVGFKCDYIMRSVLSVSALHLAHYRPHMRDYYLGLATMHHQWAARTATALMVDLASAKTAETLFLFSVMTVIFGTLFYYVVTPSVPPDSATPKSSSSPSTNESLVITPTTALASPRKESDFLLIGESGFPDWLFLLRGTWTFVNLLASEHSLGVEGQGGILSPLFNHGVVRWKAREDAYNQHDSPSSRGLDELVANINQAPGVDPALKQVYHKAIEELRKSYAAAFYEGSSTPGGGSDGGARVAAAGDVGINVDATSVFIWLFMVAEDLLPLLRVPTQEAVVILAHFCIILRRLDGHWWMHGWAEHLISRIYTMLDEEHRLWIRFPVEEMGWIPHSPLP